MLKGKSKMGSFDSSYNIMSPERFKDEDLFFGTHLYNVSWTILFKEIAPLLTPERRDFILIVAGTSTINPVIILSWLIIDKKIDNEGSDTEFHQDVKAFAEQLLTEYMESADTSNSDTNDGAFALLKVLGEDYARLRTFLAVYGYITEQNVKEQNSYKLDRSWAFNRMSQKTKQQDEESEEALILPYTVGECWNIGNIYSSIILFEKNITRNMTAEITYINLYYLI